jgi:RibD C-terminal domain
MTATYTFDVFSSLDGFGSHSGGDWGGYWGKQGAELLDRRLAVYDAEQRMVFGANTYRLFAQFLASATEESEVHDAWVARLKEESDVPLRSHGSLSMNRALIAAGLVDRVHVTLFPVITGQTGAGLEAR